MRVGSLCSGIGGLDLALESLGMETSWFVENNEFCQKILKKHWPSTPIYGDLKKLTSSVPGSPASPSVSQGNSMERATPGTSGLKYSEPSLIYDPLTRSLRTCQVSLLTNTLEPFSGTYMKHGTMRSGAVFPRKKSVPPIGGNGSLSWLTPDHQENEALNWMTPMTRDWKDGGNPSEAVPTNGLLGRQAPRWPALDAYNDPKSGGSAPHQESWDRAKQQIHLHHASTMFAEKTEKWPTPQEDDSSNVNPKANRRVGLVKKVNEYMFGPQAPRWPTPQARDWKGFDPPGKKNTKQDPEMYLSVSQHGPQAPQTQKGGPTSSSDGPTSHQPQGKRLNPMFVEWLMGLEPSWTELPG